MKRRIFIIICIIAVLCGLFYKLKNNKKDENKVFNNITNQENRIEHNINNESEENKNNIVFNSSQEIEDENSKQGMEVTMIGGSNMKENGNINSCGYIIRSKNDKLIVVDGGRDIDAKFVLDYIRKYKNGTVNYWYITHPHTDHIGALLKLLEEENIVVLNLYYSFNSDEWYKKYDERGYETEHAIIEQLNNVKIRNRVSCKKGQVIEMDNIRCDILRVANPEITYSDNGNDSSMVFKMTATDVNKSILFLGDAFYYTSEELMQEPEKLKSDAVQMAHHGQNGISKEAYDAIDSKVCFFNCPEWLYNNDNGNGYNSGEWQSIIVRGWMEEKNTTNYLAFEGDKTVRFTKNGLTPNN